MAADAAARAEAFLFVEGGSLSLKKLAELVGVKQPELAAVLDEMRARLQGRGLTLVVSDTEATLAVAQDASQAVEEAFEKEMGREIGDAGLEVLAIVLYRGPSTRAQIDYIRGVNTSSTIRTLMSRGLLERAGNPDDAREYLYRPTTELLAYLGAEQAQTLPDYESIKHELDAFENRRTTEETLHDDHGDTA